MSRKIKYYLETSVPSMYYSEDAVEKQIITKEFFKNMNFTQNEYYISNVVALEIQNAGEPRRSRLRNLLNNYELIMLEETSETTELTEKYVKAGVVPVKYRLDAVHISIAVVNRIDFIVSWNMQHIVKTNTRYKVNSINKELNYPVIDICTPEEV
ncbi:MAG: hypothetical protein A2452_04995 [Candidatus Firestonebacteria bacterium RIFOXYC2_FULL_39_67]|nr:MAG: hypothetical protein A2536_08950 [Candidatus Firestonebacteria bacterium RIFOXYD2_FULL_39_29]OGF56331.1 MAG: hypothetical protein A2452_04995 [Candidatus Firestonebacteria bacterium RIFOXYC2_FULL_39_67]